MRTEDVNTSDSIPLADLAAEATNEGAPAQSVPETIPPHARAKGDKDKDARKEQTPIRKRE